MTDGRKATVVLNYLEECDSTTVVNILSECADDYQLAMASGMLSMRSATMAIVR